MCCDTLLQCRYFQPPSVCVNAAGITRDEFLLKMEDEDFDKVIQVNLKVLPFVLIVLTTIYLYQWKKSIKGFSLFRLSDSFTLMH